jgi:chromosomal replication initiator protein
MDAKQVWRAVLGELQVSLSAANFETWLKDTSLEEIDEHLFRISAPNGFTRDWLDSRYRTLISQTLARVSDDRCGSSSWSPMRPAPPPTRPAMT